MTPTLVDPGPSIPQQPVDHDLNKISGPIKIRDERTTGAKPTSHSFRTRIIYVAEPSRYAPPMALDVTKDSIDLGIVVRDIDAMLVFYRDTLGLPLTADMPMPGAHMWRIGCGTTVIKLVKLNNIPADGNPPGGIGGATGLRYFTISVSNLAEATAACEAAGYAVVRKPVEIRPGVTISIVADPEGNWVEFLQMAS